MKKVLWMTWMVGRVLECMYTKRKTHSEYSWHCLQHKQPDNFRDKKREGIRIKGISKFSDVLHTFSSFSPRISVSSTFFPFLCTLNLSVFLPSFFTHSSSFSSSSVSISSWTKNFNRYVRSKRRSYGECNSKGSIGRLKKEPNSSRTLF